MITFICCSINPELAAGLEENIAQTAGVPFEFIAFDNRQSGFGICKVYNDCAKDAKYDYLCFLHEDARFKSQDWAATIIEKLREEDCGAIGFAGSTVKYKAPSSWGCLYEASRSNIIQHHPNGKVTNDTHNPNNEEFAHVITLDGVCMFVRRDVWQGGRFDEVLLDRFHCYDLDFAFTLTDQGCKNYVCFTLSLEHLSMGSYNPDWVEATRKLHDKWIAKLPMCTPDWAQEMDKYSVARVEYQVSRHAMKNLKDIYPPSKVATKFFSRYWNKSHYAWLIMVKLIRDKLK